MSEHILPTAARERWLKPRETMTHQVILGDEVQPGDILYLPPDEVRSEVMNVTDHIAYVAVFARHCRTGVAGNYLLDKRGTFSIERPG